MMGILLYRWKVEKNLSWRATKEPNDGWQSATRMYQIVPKPFGVGPRKDRIVNNHVIRMQSSVATLFLKSGAIKVHALITEV